MRKTSTISHGSIHSLSLSENLSRVQCIFVLTPQGPGPGSWWQWNVPSWVWGADTFLADVTPAPVTRLCRGRSQSLRSGMSRWDKPGSGPGIVRANKYPHIFSLPNSHLLYLWYEIISPMLLGSPLVFIMTNFERDLLATLHMCYMVCGLSVVVERGDWGWGLTQDRNQSHTVSPTADNCHHVSPCHTSSWLTLSVLYLCILLISCSHRPYMLLGGPAIVSVWEIRTLWTSNKFRSALFDSDIHTSLISDSD